MNSKERVFIYAGLIVAIALALGVRTPSATADFQQDETPTIAVVDVLGLLEQTLLQPEYVTPREERYNTLVGQIDEAQGTITMLQNELQSLPQTDPNWQTLYQQYQEAGSRFQELETAAAEEFQAFNANQAAEAYLAVTTAANEIAAEMGISYVIASRTDLEIAEPFTLPQVTQEILSRPMVRGSEQYDITEEVREHMDLQEPVIPNFGGAPAGPDPTTGDDGAAPAEGGAAPEGGATPAGDAAPEGDG